MNIPTKKKVKEFWEACGFKYDKYDFVSSLSSELNHTIEGWLSPEAGNKEPYDDKYFSSTLPDIDLNNLFKYAVPVAVKKIMVEQECSEGLAYEILFKKWQQEGFNALALFWATSKVIKEV